MLASCRAGFCTLGFVCPAIRANWLFGFRLEHLTSSLNGVRERDLIDDARRKGWVAYLLPHAYVHSWCGKFRRPAGMCTPDYQTPQKTRLLWVYEGLAQYLGDVLAVRGGLMSPSEYLDSLTETIRTLSHHEGRRWRPLEDTAVASHLLRARSPNWNDLRRDQDYYLEGMLLWLEADTIIREHSRGQKSLDDFCREFLGASTATAKVVPYDLPEIIEILRSLADFDWEAFLAPGMKVIAVNQKTFSHERLLDALVDSVELHKIELTLIEGERFRTISIDYSEGPRRLALARDESKPDALGEILKPLTAAPKVNSSDNNVNPGRAGTFELPIMNGLPLVVGGVAFGIFFAALRWRWQTARKHRF
jgi:M61 glycyl aminopeptidase